VSQEPRGAGRTPESSGIAGEISACGRNSASERLLTPFVGRVSFVNRLGLPSNSYWAAEILSRLENACMSTEDKDERESQEVPLLSECPRKLYGPPRLRVLGQVSAITMNASADGGFSRKKPQG
jgi:hypothetical protein